MGFKDHLNVYEFECTLPGTGQLVKYKPITTNQIKKLLVYENEQNPIKIEEAFDILIRSCVISEDFNINDIYDKDREFLLIELRKVSKGEIYEYQFTCPRCKSGNLSHINFSSFPIKNRENTPGSIDISNGVSITIDNITRKEQKDAYKSIPTDTQKKQIPMMMGLYSMAAGIKNISTPDGLEENLSIDDKYYIIDTLTVNVIDKIKSWHLTNTFGYDLSYKFKCVHCDYESDKQKLEVNSNFF